MTSLADKINRVFASASNGGIDIVQLRVGATMSSANRKSNRNSWMTDQVGEDDEITPADRLSDFLDQILQEGRWSFLKKLSVVNYENDCRTFIMASLVYTHLDGSYMSDDEFDALSNKLMLKYKELPQWFTERVPLENLECGSSLGLVYTSDEFERAETWFEAKSTTSNQTDYDFDDILG